MRHVIDENVGITAIGFARRNGIGETRIGDVHSIGGNDGVITLIICTLYYVRISSGRAVQQDAVEDILSIGNGTGEVQRIAEKLNLGAISGNGWICAMRIRDLCQI